MVSCRPVFVGFDMKEIIHWLTVQITNMQRIETELTSVRSEQLLGNKEQSLLQVWPRRIWSFWAARTSVSVDISRIVIYWDLHESKILFLFVHSSKYVVLYFRYKKRQQSRKKGRECNMFSEVASTWPCSGQDPDCRWRSANLWKQTALCSAA